MLIPSYFLIKLWGGGAERHYAALKFVLYTLLGSVFMLVGIALLNINFHQWASLHHIDQVYSFDLLELLLFNAGIVLTREQIYERIWGFDFETSSKSLDVYISYLRRKTEETGESRLIHTVRGVGYTARPS